VLWQAAETGELRHPSPLFTEQLVQHLPPPHADLLTFIMQTERFQRNKKGN
jgi:hypothetical protein